MMLASAWLVLLLAGCAPTNPNPPTIGCSTTELIDAILDANTNPDHDHIVMPENCNYQLGELVFEIPDPDQYNDYGYAGLPSILSPITITGNGSRIFRPNSGNTAEYRILHVGADGILTLVELDLENGLVQGRGGAVLVEKGTLTLNQCVLRDNRAAEAGGAISNVNGHVVLTNAVLSHNTAGTGGAIHNAEYGRLEVDFQSVLEHNEATWGFGGAIDISTGLVTINFSTIRNNVARFDGGGISVDPGTADLYGVTIENNQAAVGGGIYADGNLTVSASQIRQNQASSGGGIFLWWEGEISIGQDTRIYENMATDYGGGICLDGGSTLDLEQVAIMNNQAGVAGGGIGHGPNLIPPAVRMTRSTVSGNTTDGPGGGIYINSGEWEIEASTISGNSADEGGGIYNTDALLSMLNSTISMNQAQRGGGLIHDSSAAVTLSFVTLAENTAGSGAGLVVDAGLAQITNSIVSGNMPFDCQGSTQPLDANLDGDGSCGFSLTADPLLEPLALNGGPTRTHAIPSFSPAAEASATCLPFGSLLALGVDQRGEPRPQGAVCDLGAFEAVISTIPLPPLPTPTATVRAPPPPTPAPALPACSPELPKEQCEAAGGTWSAVSYPPCTCP
jgi:predicted outer membrane repeat protein